MRSSVSGTSRSSLPLQLRLVRQRLEAALRRLDRGNSCVLPLQVADVAVAQRITAAAGFDILEVRQIAVELDDQCQSVLNSARSPRSDAQC